MSVFEDLIGELKNENLLEDTIINIGPADAAARDAASAGNTSGGAVREDRERAASDVDSAEAEGVLEIDVPRIEKPSSESEFFRKRAMDEVSSLQMVEHVLSGVEREHMKISPVAYDDLNAKRALHKFIQVSEDFQSAEHAEAELALRQETEAWSFALYERDQKISVANIRRFCEDSRPVLSSQALIALARFYRNSPYSEDVRGKFDYVMTRLFSRETGEGTRALLFEHNEMIGHINTLYANWSSIALYTHEDDQVEVLLTVTRFDEFTDEVESAETFDELLETEFFSRVRTYKEESAEMSYVPEVLAAAIRCNLAIGNRYVDLIGKERSAASVERIEEKYGIAYDQIVSDAAGRTLLLADVLAREPEEPILEETVRPEQEAPVVVRSTKPKAKPVEKKSRASSRFAVNKWVIVFCIVMVLAGGGVYIWAEKFAGGGTTTEQVAKPVTVDDQEIRKYIRSPRQTNETFYAVVEPSFETLSADEQKALLGKVRAFAASRSLNKVNLINKEGKTVAFASKDRLELVTK